MQYFTLLKFYTITFNVHDDLHWNTVVSNLYDYERKERIETVGYWAVIKRVERDG